MTSYESILAGYMFVISNVFCNNAKGTIFLYLIVLIKLYKFCIPCIQSSGMILVALINWINFITMQGHFSVNIFHYILGIKKNWNKIIALLYQLYWPNVYAKHNFLSRFLFSLRYILFSWIIQLLITKMYYLHKS